MDKKKKVFAAIIGVFAFALFYTGYVFIQTSTNRSQEPLGKGDFRLNDNGTVALGDGMISHGLFSKDGKLINPGEKAECADNKVEGKIHFQQNKQGTMEYGLIFMADFIQKEFIVENEAFTCYRFSLTGDDQVKIGVQIPVEDNTYEIEYLIVPEPDLKNFSMENELEWNNFMATRDVCSGSYRITGKNDTKRVPVTLPQIDTNKLKAADFQGNTGFELVKSSSDISIFDTAKSGGTACLCMGGMQQRDDAYVVVAFCDWKQSELAPGELLRCYTSVPDRNNYEEIRFPDIKEDAVYQIFAFSLPIESRMLSMIRKTLRIKLEKSRNSSDKVLHFGCGDAGSGAQAWLVAPAPEW